MSTQTLETLRDKIARNPLRQWRQKHGVTVFELCALLDVSASTVAKWESGAQMPVPEHYKLLASKLGNSELEQEWEQWKASLSE